MQRSVRIVVAGAIKLACPKAKQIADKFHLVKNCGEHLDKQLRVSMPDVMSELSATLDRPVESGVRQEAMYKPPGHENQRKDRCEVLVNGPTPRAQNNRIQVCGAIY